MNKLYYIVLLLLIAALEVQIQQQQVFNHHLLHILQVQAELDDTTGKELDAIEDHITKLEQDQHEGTQL